MRLGSRRFFCVCVFVNASNTWFHSPNHENSRLQRHFEKGVNKRQLKVTSKYSATAQHTQAAPCNTVLPLLHVAQLASKNFVSHSFLFRVPICNKSDGCVTESAGLQTEYEPSDGYAAWEAPECFSQIGGWRHGPGEKQCVCSRLNIAIVLMVQ